VIEFIVASLATYAVSTLVSAYDGPGMIFASLRRVWPNSWLQDLLECPVCLSVWVSVPFALLISSDWQQFLLNWLGAVGVVILIKEWE